MFLAHFPLASKVARKQAELYTHYTILICNHLFDDFTMTNNSISLVTRCMSSLAVGSSFGKKPAVSIGRVFVLLFSLALSGVVSAQSTGLKLGQEAPEKPKLDLGAAPKAKPQPKAAAPATPAGVVTNGAWQVSCVEGADCAMAQIGKDKSGTPILEMVVRKLPAPLEADGRTAIAVIDFITPLGVVLTSGLELKIDAGKGEAAPFQICTEQGCLVREPVDQGLIDRLIKGNNALVSVVAANQGNVSATISLSGFTKSYNSLR